MLSIAKRIDQLPSTPMLRKILLVTGIIWVFVAMNQGMVSGVIAAIGQDWELTPGQLGWLASAGMIGMALGATLSGIAADKWGRKTLIIGNLIIFGVASGLSGFAVNYPMLLVLRFLTGFGLGGEGPVAFAFISEYSPTRIRGRNGILLESFWAWGWILSALVAYFLIPGYGWRVAFWIGAVPALLAVVYHKAIPESPRYLASAGRTEEADALVRIMEEQAGIEYNAHKGEKANLEQESHEPAEKVHVGFIDLWSKKYVRTTLVLWVIWFGVNFGYYGFVLWTPTLLLGKGFTLVKSFEFTLIMCLAQLPGYYSAAWLVERIGRKPALFCILPERLWLPGSSDMQPARRKSCFMDLCFTFSAWAPGDVFTRIPRKYIRLSPGAADRVGLPHSGVWVHLRLPLSCRLYIISTALTLGLRMCS